MSVSGATASPRIGLPGSSRDDWVVLCAVVVWFGAPAAALAFTGWSAPTDINGDNGLSSVCSPTSPFCVAVSTQNGAALTYQNGTWSSTSTVDNGNGLTSVSCSSVSYCVAVDNAGNRA